MQQRRAPFEYVLITGLAVIAVVHVFLYCVWLERIAFPTTLSKTHAKSAEQIFNSQDPYYTVRSFLRRYVRASRDLEAIVLVSTQVQPPTRFDLEVYYELYPVTPTKVAVGSPELRDLVEDAKKGTVFISDTALTLDQDLFKTTVAEQAFIYERQ